MLYLILIAGIVAAYYVGKHGLSTVIQTIGTELGAIFHRTSPKEAAAELKTIPPASATAPEASAK